MDILGDVPIIWWIASTGIVLTVLLSINSLRLLGKIEQERSLRISQSTRYGQISEQFLPLVEQYPYDPKQFRFLGSPIDGVQFEEDKVVLVEFKAAGSRLSARQRKVRDLVREGKIEFREIKIS